MLIFPSSGTGSASTGSVSLLVIVWYETHVYVRS
jgi:hypothetical protein